MMSSGDLIDFSDDGAPDVDVDVRADFYETDFLNVLAKIRPEWKPEDVVYEESEKGVTKGRVNTMVRCYRRGDPRDSIMIRIYNRLMEAWFNRRMEIRCIKYFQDFDCTPTPKLVATFRSGFCYEFIEGEVLTNLQLKEEPIWRRIAEELAKIHTANFEDERKEAGETYFDQAKTRVNPLYPTEMKDPAKNERFKREIPPKEVMEKEFDTAYDHALSFNPDVVFCHNDPRAENIVWNQKTGVAKLVDFESVMYNYQALEIATHFERFAGFTPPDLSLIPDDLFQLRWIRVYLEKYFEVTGRKSGDVTDLDVRKLFVQVQKFRLVIAIAMGFAGPVFDNMSIAGDDASLDQLGSGILYVKYYYQHKDEIMALEMPEEA